jgi:hypothetical protein
MARGILTRQQILGTFCQESGCQVLTILNERSWWGKAYAAKPAARSRGRRIEERILRLS